MTAFSQVGAMFVLAASLLAVIVAGDGITSKLQVHVSTTVVAVKKDCVQRSNNNRRASSFRDSTMGPAIWNLADL
jgi:hypothetical protein